MANERQRLTFEVPVELHARLKAEAAQKGVSLGSHCASILSGEVNASPAIEGLDQSTLSYLPMGSLRELCEQTLQDRPKDWKRQLANINAEMRRRFKT